MPASPCSVGGRPPLANWVQRRRARCCDLPHQRRGLHPAVRPVSLPLLWSSPWSWSGRWCCCRCRGHGWYRRALFGGRCCRRARRAAQRPHPGRCRCPCCGRCATCLQLSTGLPVWPVPLPWSRLPVSMVGVVRSTPSRPSSRVGPPLSGCRWPCPARWPASSSWPLPAPLLRSMRRLPPVAQHEPVLLFGKYTTCIFFKLLIYKNFHFHPLFIRRLDRHGWRSAGGAIDGRHARSSLRSPRLRRWPVLLRLLGCGRRCGRYCGWVAGVVDVDAATPAGSCSARWPASSPWPCLSCNRCGGCPKGSSIGRRAAGRVRDGLRRVRWGWCRAPTGCLAGAAMGLMAG